MENPTGVKDLDVVIVVDSTGSMDPFLVALIRFLPQLLAARALTNSPSTSGIRSLLPPFRRRLRKIGILTYKDYYPVPAQLFPNQINSIVHPIPANDAAAAALTAKLKIEDVISWSGWDCPTLRHTNKNNLEDDKTATRLKGVESQHLSEWVKGITAEGGGDYPEAAKTALRMLLDLINAKTEDQKPEDPSDNQQAETVVIWYTDAPPHHRSHRGINRILEIAAHDCVPSEHGWLSESEKALTASQVSPEKPDKSQNPQQLPPNVRMTPYLGKINTPTPLPPTIPASKCIDWIHLTKAAAKGGLQVYTIVPPSMPDSDSSFYALLGAATGGGVFVVGGKESKSEKNAEDSGDGDGSGWYNELIVSGGAPFVKTVTALSLEIILALVGLEDPSSRLLEEESDPESESVDMEMSTPPPVEQSTASGRGRRGGYWSKGHYYPPRGRRRRVAFRDVEDDEKELEEILNKETTAREVPVQWLRFEEDVRMRMRDETGTDTKDKPINPSSEDERDKKEESQIPKAENETPPLCDEDFTYGFLPMPWKGAALYGAGKLKRISRKNIEGCGLTRQVTGTSERASITGDKEAMETSIQTESDGVPSETVNLLLKQIVEVDVEAISKVWLFGEMWRSVSKQPPTDSQSSLFSLYSERVERIKDEELRQRLKDWAAINHDASEEIAILLSKSSITDVQYSRDVAKPNENLVLYVDDGAAGQSGLTRENVFDLTRICEKNVLKKMGYLLRHTRVLPVTDATTKNHLLLSNTSPDTIFRVLPHLIFEGVMYTPRTATILATIAITSHISHLMRPAQLLLESTQGSWLNPLTPENFSSSFTSFILSLPSKDMMLSSEEKGVYEGMAKYTFLEDNLDTKIQGLVPWTPMKTRGVGDRKRVCEGCGIRRSETMMHQVGSQIKKRRYAGLDGTKQDIMEEVSGMRCGMCVDSDTKNPEDWKDQGEIQSCWVECSERWCRAQYVIEDEEGLRIPPRCYYCRKRRPCPWIECTKCANRIILPKSYRILPADSASNFVCPPCQNQEFTGHKTIVHKLTTLRSILFANDYEVEWLGIKPFKEIFRGRSTFVIWELYGGEIFASVTPSLSPLGTPPTSSPPSSPIPLISASDKKRKNRRLELYGKRLLNPSTLRDELNGIVDRAMKKDRVLCGMSYDFVLQADMAKACGDNACTFYASVEGLKEWYLGEGERRKQCPACRGPGKAM